jgi:hypothetical protein
VTLSKSADKVLRRAIARVARERIPVFTFALYFDHESSALSVCVDTQANSTKVVAAINRYNAKHFRAAVDAKDLKAAALWQANIGRSLSLGDFALVNLARTEVPNAVQDAKLDLALVRALVAVEAQVLSLAPKPDRVLFACSGADDEVAYVWSAAGVA